MTLEDKKPRADLVRASDAIAAIAAGFPEVTQDTPWGHLAFKVRGKTFLFLSLDGEGLGLSVKLPHSGEDALQLPFTEPTHYGLGKAGWVSASFSQRKEIVIPLIGDWLRESYCAIAPKKLAALLGEGEPESPPKIPTAASAKKQAGVAKTGTARKTAAPRSAKRVGSAKKATASVTRRKVAKRK